MKLYEDVSVYVSVSVSMPVSVSVSMPVSVPVSMSASVCIRVSFSLSPSLPLYLPLSLFSPFAFTLAIQHSSGQGRQQKTGGCAARLVR